MQKILLASAAFMALAGGSFGLAATASAAPAGASSVEKTIYDLRTQGYNVQLNGTRNGPLSNCSVDSVRGASDASVPGATVYVDLSCPAEYQY
ncbi:hypothetical protein H7J08_04565 [Mycobacterium frederiksbergense]|uniref:PASTA domain-containing protein n=1 Tax=Mycolicibacterium frederiksbergense TaxID=117567 RepID=A0A6H0SDE1_9MYCO|nr:hypothetical protein [Mycolicibacterium frederiksbergense]MCV7043950.1 hypothetical protein [Mycolicibacterium frederiksbergense]QIV84037.1 hypothetical protein EXE63_26515 [Mycolicibacterium frederiksbergense]